MRVAQEPGPGSSTSGCHWLRSWRARLTTRGALHALFPTPLPPPRGYDTHDIVCIHGLEWAEAVYRHAEDRPLIAENRCSQNKLRMDAGLSKRLASVHPVIEKICNVSGVPGLCLGVSQRGQVVHRFYYGFSDLDAAIPTDSNTTYGIGSITKTFTATAIVQLVGEGKLKCTTPVRDILPDFYSENPIITTEATVEDLLTHRVALSRSNNWWYGAGGELLLQKDQTLQAYSELMRPTGPFRSQFDYSNWNYAVASEIVKRVNGKSYTRYIDGAILEPLALANISALHSSLPASKVTKAYVTLDNLDFFLLPRPQAQDGTIMGSAQGILSIVDDLLGYGTVLLQSAGFGHRSSAHDPAAPQPLKNIDRQLSGHMFTNKSSLFEPFYGLGVFRHELPGSIASTGANGMFVKSLPQIVPGGDEARHLSSGKPSRIHFVLRPAS